MVDMKAIRKYLIIFLLFLVSILAAQQSNSVSENG